MDLLPTELIDHIIYFTQNTIFDLSLVNKYFTNRVKIIRITDNENYPAMEDKHLKELLNISSLIIDKNRLLTNIISLTNLKSLRLKDNQLTTNKDLSKLSKLTQLDIEYCYQIRDKGISSLTNLTSLRLVDNSTITNEGISNLTNLTSLVLINNFKINVEGVESLPNLTYFEIAGAYYPHLSESNLFPRMPKTPGLIINNQIIGI